jgi:hypothetical protein
MLLQVVASVRLATFGLNAAFFNDKGPKGCRQCFTADAFARFVVRDPVKIDHAVSVRLKDGRDVEIVTRSDFSILLPIDYR